MSRLCIYVFFCNFIAIPPAMQCATSLLLSHSDASTISDSSNSLTEAFTLSSSSVCSVFSCSQLESHNLSSDRHLRIFSEVHTSRKITRNRPPLIERYWEKRRSIGSLCKRLVRMNSDPSTKRSSISMTFERSVHIKVSAVCLLRQKFEVPSFHCSIQSASSEGNFRR